MANLFAAAIVKFGHTNDKLVLASDAMVDAAMDKFVVSFDFEGMINDFLDGINLDGLKDTTTSVRETTSEGLRRASEFVEPDAEEA